MISLVLFTASALILVPVQAECLFDSTAVYSCLWSYTVILLLSNSKFRTVFQKGWKFSKYSLASLRKLISMILPVLCPPHVNNSCNNVKIGNLCMVVRKLQIHSGFLHTNLYSQAQSCLHGKGPKDFMLKNKVCIYI